MYFLADSRSNGGILATPLSLKAAVGLPHPMSAALVPHPHDSTLWIEPGRGPVWAGEANRIADLLEPADYAEVDPVCQSFGKGDGSVSPAPYATTTLVPKYSGGSTTSTRQLLHSSNSRIPQVSTSCLGTHLKQRKSDNLTIQLNSAVSKTCDAASMCSNEPTITAEYCL